MSIGHKHDKYISFNRDPQLQMGENYSYLFYNWAQIFANRDV